jgi:hypothetical protein
MNDVKFRIKNVSNDNQFVGMTNSFLLRGIDPYELINSYYNGQFSSAQIPDSKTKLSEAFINPNRILGVNSDSECYKFSDKIGTSQTIITTNHDRFLWFKNGCKEIMPISFCQKCQKQIVGTPTGIPIKMEYDSMVSRTIYHVEDTFCTFECCLLALRQYKLRHRFYKDPNYMNSEQMLYTLYKQVYPNEPFLKQDSINRHPYIDVRTIILVPVKRQFLKFSLHSSHPKSIKNTSFKERVVKDVKLVWVNSNDDNICKGCQKHIQTDPIGIPIKMEYNNTSKQTTYHLKDHFCSFRCCLTMLRQYVSSHQMYRDFDLVDTEYMLRLLYKSLHPNDQPLKERPDWRLLNVNNNGPINEQEFFSDSQLYIDTRSIVFIPMKRQPIKISIK